MILRKQDNRARPPPSKTPDDSDSRALLSDDHGAVAARSSAVKYPPHGATPSPEASPPRRRSGPHPARNGEVCYSNKEIVEWIRPVRRGRERGVRVYIPAKVLQEAGVPVDTPANCILIRRLPMRTMPKSGMRVGKSNGRQKQIILKVKVVGGAGP